jgi:hypothetical protein
MTPGEVDHRPDIGDPDDAKELSLVPAQSFSLRHGDAQHETNERSRCEDEKGPAFAPIRRKSILASQGPTMYFSQS